MSSTLSPDSTGKKTKERRFEMRLTEEDDALLAEAAALTGASRSDLGTAAIRRYATNIIADYRATLVSAEEFATLQAALDAPAVPNERTRRAVLEMRAERDAQK